MNTGRGDSRKLHQALKFTICMGEAQTKRRLLAIVNDFFRTGNQFINSLSVSTGTEKKSEAYASYANTYSNGIEPGNTFYRNNFAIRNTSKLFNDKVTLDASANYIDQKTTDRPTSGTYFNPLFGLYLFPRGGNFAQYKNFEVYDPSRSLMVQNWPASFQAGPFTDNPYWVQQRDPTSLGLNRFVRISNL